MFVIGKPPPRSPEAKSLHDQIDAESRQHGDILQENFIDTYQNLTVKIMFALKFAEMNLEENSAWIMVKDDDSYVNIPGVMALLNSPGFKKLNEKSLVGAVCYEIY